MPMSQHRVALRLGLKMPLEHLHRCRPVGLLLLLLNIHYQVHRVADDFVKEQLEQWTWCKKGWEDWCMVAGDPESQLLGDSPSADSFLHSLPTLPALQAACEAYVLTSLCNYRRSKNRPPCEVP